MTGVEVYGPEAVRRAVGFRELIEPVARVLGEYSQGVGGAPQHVFAPAGADGDVHVKSAWLPDHPVFTVKVAGWFAARAATGRGPASGFVAVHSATTGDLLALLDDEHHLSDVRTAAAGAVATRLLARDDARVLAVLGTGTQAHLQALAAHAVRPLHEIRVWGRHPTAARTLATTLTAALSSPAPSTRPPDPASPAGPVVRAVDDPERAVRGADLVVTATSSREPVLRGAWLEPGQHVTAVGADDLTKAELDPDCFARADLLAVDSRTETPAFAGDLAAALATGTVGPLVELGELVLGRVPARRCPDQLTVAKLIGLGVEDLAAAELALPRLRHPTAAAANPRP